MIMKMMVMIINRIIMIIVFDDYDDRYYIPVIHSFDKHSEALVRFTGSVCNKPVRNFFISGLIFLKIGLLVGILMSC